MDPNPQQQHRCICTIPFRDLSTIPFRDLRDDRCRDADRRSIDGICRNSSQRNTEDRLRNSSQRSGRTRSNNANYPNECSCSIGLQAFAVTEIVNVSTNTECNSVVTVGVQVNAPMTISADVQTEAPTGPSIRGGLTPPTRVPNRRRVSFPPGLGLQEPDAECMSRSVKRSNVKYALEHLHRDDGDKSTP